MPEPRAQRSLWAIASLACSIALCPPLCIIGPVLGAIGLLQLRRHPELRGRGLALGGIGLGLAMCVVWLVLFAWYDRVSRQPMLEGPRDLIQLGQAGDVGGFQAGFVGPGAAPAARAEATRFLATLTERYGRLSTSRLDVATIETRGTIDRAAPRLPYELIFERETVAVDAVFVRFRPPSLRWIMRWESIDVYDTVRGDLSYPVTP